jgi:hypothetical protein
MYDGFSRRPSSGGMARVATCCCREMCRRLARRLQAIVTKLALTERFVRVLHERRFKRNLVVAIQARLRRWRRYMCGWRGNCRPD